MWLGSVRSHSLESCTRRNLEEPIPSATTGTKILSARLRAVHERLITAYAPVAVAAPHFYMVRAPGDTHGGYYSLALDFFGRIAYVTHHLSGVSEIRTRLYWIPIQRTDHCAKWHINQLTYLWPLCWTLGTLSLKHICFWDKNISWTSIGTSPPGSMIIWNWTHRDSNPDVLNTSSALYQPSYLTYQQINFLLVTILDFGYNQGKLQNTGITYKRTCLYTCQLHRNKLYDHRNKSKRLLKVITYNL